MGRLKMTEDPATFFSMVEATPSGCWEWQGARDDRGYGQTRVGMKRVKTHRKVWALLYGEIPEGMSILHHCDNPPCVRPNHLFIGTALDNRRDAIAKGRVDRYATLPNLVHESGEKNSNARLTADQVASIRALAATRAITQKAMAVQYGISQTQVSRIVLGTSWKEE